MRSLVSFGLLYLVACESDKSVVARNPEPVVNIITHQNGSTVLEAMPTMFIGSVTDANHSQDDLTASWYVEGDIPEGCEDLVPDENHEVRCTIQMGLNDSTIILVGSDPEGSTGRKEIDVDVEPTEAPVCEILSPTSNGQYYSDYLIQFEAQVSDAEDAPEDIEVIWSSSIDGDLTTVDSEPNSTGQVSGTGNLSEGQHSIEIQCTDTSGKQTTESVIIDVGPPNTSPDCSISNPAMNSAGPVGGLVSFEGVVSDVDVAPSELTVEWSSDKDGILTTNPSIPDSSGNVLFPFSDLSINTHVISMTVRDEVGAECVANTTFTVGTAPIVSITSPNNGDVINEGEAITFTAEVSDNEDQPNQVSLDWTLDGNAFSTQTATSSGTATFSDATLTYGTYNLQVTATDTAGLFETDQVSFQVNGLPGAPIISLNPTLPTTTDDLTVLVDVDSIDPESHSITYSYAWERDGVLQPSHTGVTVPSSATSKGEIWTVSVTPNDGYGDGTSATADVTVQNTAPMVTNLSLIPNSPIYNDDQVSCNATIIDPDENLIPTFEWLLNGNNIHVGDTIDLTVFPIFPQDQISCQVSVIDSDGETDSLINSHYIDNRSITMNGVQLDNYSPNFADTLTCTISFTDLDNDVPNVTYVWSSLTTFQTLYTETSQNISSTFDLSNHYIELNDEIQCEAIISDGQSSDIGVDSAFVDCFFGSCDQSINVGNGLGIDVVLLSGGVFDMGSPDTEPGRQSNEEQHQVTLTNDFWITTTEITQGMFASLLGYSPMDDQTVTTNDIGLLYPANFVTWDMSAHFANKLTEYSNSTLGSNFQSCYSCSGSGVSVVCQTSIDPVYSCSGFRLLTEAEWEFAARAGSSHGFWTPDGGADLPVNFDNYTSTLTDGFDLSLYGWYMTNSTVSGSYEVAQLIPNSYGLYDMSGNLWEYVHDKWSGAYSSTSVVNPVNEVGSIYTIRGGHVDNGPQYLRVNRRLYNDGSRTDGKGFRIGRTN